MPRMILNRDNAAATGRFWIEPASGRVVQTEISLEAPRYRAKVAVTYADQPKIALWVPIRMLEDYSEFNNAWNLQQPATINARAEYQNFRRYETLGRLIVK